MYMFLALFTLISATTFLHSNNAKWPSTRSLGNWTSSQWRGISLGGDTPYSKSFATTTPTCQPEQTTQYKTFSEWKEACSQLPRFNRQLRNKYQTVLSANAFAKEIEDFSNTMQQCYNNMFWIGGIKPDPSCTGFQTYAEKLIIPTDSKVAIHGDLHGDIHALNRFITWCAAQGFMDLNNAFKIIDKKFYILFLGDYVDRGWYGAEVLYAIMRLKNENPNNVFMVRGNHEDVAINGPYGFAAELAGKFFGTVFTTELQKLYNKLPVVLYLGTEQKNKSQKWDQHYYDMIQCCHGGIELGFDPQKLFFNWDLHKHNIKRAHELSKHMGIIITDLAQETQHAKLNSPDLTPFKKYFHNMPISTNNGFMWNDFIVDPTIPFALSARDGRQGSMFDYGQAVTRQVLDYMSSKDYKIHAVFRAHQHSDPDMKARILNLDQLSHPDDTGMGKLWIENSMHQTTPGRLDNVAAITFSVAPDTGYGYTIDAFGLLTVADNYANWRLQTVRLPYRVAK